MTNGGGAQKFDQDRPRYDLMPIAPLEEIAAVFAFGAKKYGDRNWEKGLGHGRLFRATVSHLFKHWRGEDRDEESGLSHLAHAGASLLMLMDTVALLPHLDTRSSLYMRRPTTPSDEETTS